MKHFLFLFLFFLFVLTAQATNYYSDPVSGSMSNSGTSASPWANLEAIMNSSNTFVTGDIIFLRNGSHGFPKINKVNAGYVQITPQSGHNPTITRINVGSSSAASFWKLTGLTIQTINVAAFPISLITLFPVSSNIIIENCTIQSINNTTAYTRNDWRNKTNNGITTEGSGHTIRGNTLKNIAIGLSIESENTLVSNNTIQYFTIDGIRGLASDCIYDGNTVMDNMAVFIFSENHYDGFQSFTCCPVGTDTIKNVILRNNLIINCTDTTRQFRGSMQGMVGFDGYFSNWTIENNIIITDHWHGITLLGALNCRIINNTVVDPYDVSPIDPFDPQSIPSHGPTWIKIAAHKNGDLSLNNTVRNNLTAVLQNDVGIGVVDFNTVIGASSNYPSHFVDFATFDYHLIPTSSAIDAGTTPLAPTTDFEGNLRPNLTAVDAGAYEYYAPSSSSSCDTLNFSPLGTLTVLQGGNGYVNGWNTDFQDVSKAEYFSAASHGSLTHVTGGIFYVWSATDAGNGATVDFNVWDATGAGGSPGAIIGTTTIQLSALDNTPGGVENNLIEILFNAPVNVGTADFYFGLTMNGFGANDSLGIVSNSDGDTTPGTAWEEWASGGGWFAHNDTSSWGINISQYMSPYMTNLPPTAIPTANTTSICEGDAINFDGSASANASVHNWFFPGGTPNTATGATTTITYAVAGNYMAYLVIDGDCQGQAVDSIAITVNAIPVVIANATNTTVCVGDPVTLTGSGATSYTWDNGVIDGTAFNPTNTAIYTVTGTSSGCTNTNQITITVNPLPTVVANATTTTVCAGDPVTLTGSGATSYTWDNGITDGAAFNPAATTTYTVTGTSNGCTNTDQITVTVSTTLPVVANATNTTICVGDIVTLTGSGATSYTWDNGVIDGAAFAPTATATYTVIGASGSCSNTDQITITVNPLPTVVANATSTAICAGDAVTLTGSGATSYSWDNGVTDGMVFNPTTTTTYTVTGSTNGCTNTDQIIVAVTTVNISTTVNAQGNIILANGTPATYQWIDCDNGNVMIAGETSQSYIATNGNYAVIVTQNGCADTSACVSIIGVGIDDLSKNNLITIYPNPTNSSINVSLKGNNDVIKIELFDVTGKLIHVNNKVITSSITIDLQNVSNGMYFLQVYSNKKVESYKVIKN